MMIASRLLLSTTTAMLFLVGVGMMTSHLDPPVAHAALPTSPSGNMFHHEIDALHNDTHHTEVLRNGTTYVHHHYHFVHPETGRHVTKNVTGILATHKYTFVTLNDTVVQSAFSKEFLAATVDDDDIDDANGNNDTTHITITLHPGDEYFAATSALLRVLETHTEDKPVVILGAEYLDHKGRHLQHRVLRWSIRNTVVKLDVYKMEYHQLFQHLQLNYEASHLPHSHTAATQSSPAFATTPPQQVARRPMSQQSSLFGWVADTISETTSAAVNTATEYASTAFDVASSAAGAMAELATGEVKWSKSDISIGTTVYNRQESNVINKASESWFVTGDVYITGSTQMDAKISFILTISNYKLQVVSVDVDATMWAEIWTRTTAELLYNKDDRALLTTIIMTPVTFAIATIPVVIRPSIPIYGGYTIRIQASLVVEVIASGMGSMSMGFTFTPDQSGVTLGTLTRRASQDIKFSPIVSKTGEISAQLYFEAFIEVNPYVQVNFIGGPYISFRVGAEAIVLSGTSAPICGFSVDVNIVPLISVGARLDISVGSLSLIDIVFTPKVVYNNKYSLLAYCYSPPPTPAPGVAYVFSSDDDGAVYSGSIKATPQCSDTQNISIQILKATATESYVISYLSTLLPDGSVLFTQQTYHVTFDTDTSVIIGPTSDLGTTFGVPSSSWNFDPFSAGKTIDGMTFSVPSDNQCNTIYVHRVLRSSGNLPAVPPPASTTTTSTTITTTTSATTTTAPTTTRTTATPATTATPTTTTTTTTPTTTRTTTAPATTTTTPTPTTTTVIIKTTSSITASQAESFINTFRSGNSQNYVDRIDGVFYSAAIATTAMNALKTSYPSASATQSGNEVTVFGLSGFSTASLRDIITYVYSSDVSGIVSGVSLTYATQSDASAMMSSVNDGGQPGFASASKQEPADAPPPSSGGGEDEPFPVLAIVGAILGGVVVGAAVVGVVVYFVLFRSKRNVIITDSNEVMLHDVDL